MTENEEQTVAEVCGQRGNIWNSYHFRPNSANTGLKESGTLSLKLQLQLLQMRERIRQSPVSELDVGVSLYFGTQWRPRRLLEFRQPWTFQIK